MEKEIMELIESRRTAELKNILGNMNAADLYDIFSDIPKRDILFTFRILPKELAAELFVELDADMRAQLISAFTDSELKVIMDDIFMDDTVDIIEEMPAIVAKRIIAQANPADRKLINQLLAYPEDSAGSIMTTEYIDLKKDMSVLEAFGRIRRIGVDKETIYTCYVIDSSRHLQGIVTARDLLLAPQEVKIADIMDCNIISANTHSDKEEVANLFDKYDLLALPVVDKENRLVGIVTVDDAIDVLQEEMTEDIEKMAAILPSDKPYLKTGVFETFKSRIIWLCLLMISATFTGLIISSFESALESVVVLTIFIPMLMSTGGNSGSQSSVTIIRGLSLGEISYSDTFRVLWKEARVGILCGAVLSVLNFVKLLVFDRVYNDAVTVSVAAVVSISMFLTVIIAKLIGCILPIGAKKIGLDPAVMANPFITTLVDTLSLALYFFIAKQLLF